MAVLDVRGEGVADRSTGFVPDAKGCRDALRNQTWVGERCELHEPDAVRVRRQQIGGNFQREPCFTYAARTCQRDDTSMGQELANVAHLTRSTDESRQLLWQVVA